MAAELLVLRIIHVLGGVFWVGALLFTTFFLAPALRQAGPSAGAVMGALGNRKLFQVLPIVAVLTMLSGLRLMWIASAGDSHWFVHRVGHTYSVSAALAIVGFIVGMAVGRPAMLKVGRLSQSAASDGASREMIAAEIAKLQKRAGMANSVVATLLILSATGMAIARYL